MKHAARIALLIMLLVALPLRGYAGVLMAFCESQHGGAAVAEENAYEHGDNHHHNADANADDELGGPSLAASLDSEWLG